MSNGGPPAFNAFGRRAESVLSGFPSDKGDNELSWRTKSSSSNNNNTNSNDSAGRNSPNSPTADVKASISGKDGSVRTVINLAHPLPSDLLLKSVISSRGPTLKSSIDFGAQSGNDNNKSTAARGNNRQSQRRQQRLLSEYVTNDALVVFGRTNSGGGSDREFFRDADVAESAAPRAQVATQAAGVLGGCVRGEVGKRGIAVGLTLRGATSVDILRPDWMTQRVILPGKLQLKTTADYSHRQQSSGSCVKGGVDVNYRSGSVLWSGTLKSNTDSVFAIPELATSVVIGSKQFAVGARCVFDGSKEPGTQWRSVQARMMQASLDTNSEIYAWTNIDTKNDGPDVTPPTSKHMAGVSFARRISPEWQLASHFSLDVRAPNSAPVVKLAAAHAVGSKATYKVRVDTTGVVAFSFKEKVSDALSLHFGGAMNIVRWKPSPKLGMHVSLSS